ncbi:MAG: ROK family protein [Ruminococcaceae bacterium]|nr:ROK family protein [Oscillospiraceae bacterium]
MMTPQARVLSLIALGKASMRQDIVDAAGLSKTAVSDIVADLIRLGYVSEAESIDAGSRAGRRAVRLTLAENSPLCCGMLVSRGELGVILTSLDGKTVAVSRRNFDAITANELCAELIDRFRMLRAQTSRTISAIGIASLGPIDSRARTITSPLNFFGICDLPIADIIERATGLPVHFIHDTGAAAIAEQLWGAGQHIDDFIYLQIYRGIGAAFMLGGKLYEGVRGNSGELGHVSIDHRGPKCACGNRGCLSLYAGIDKISREIEHLRGCGFPTVLPPLRSPDAAYSWRQVAAACSENDPAALTAMNSFCEYLAAALASVICLLNIETVVLSCEGGGMGVPEQMLERHISGRLNGYLDLRVRVLSSPFRDNTPLLGAAGMIAGKLFDGEIPLGD